MKNLGFRSRDGKFLLTVAADGINDMVNYSLFECDNMPCAFRSNENVDLERLSNVLEEEKFGSSREREDVLDIISEHMKAERLRFERNI